jgi:hypothetical protein
LRGLLRILLTAVLNFLVAISMDLLEALNIGYVFAITVEFKMDYVLICFRIRNKG